MILEPIILYLHHGGSDDRDNTTAKGNPEITCADDIDPERRCCLFVWDVTPNTEKTIMWDVAAWKRQVAGPRPRLCEGNGGITRPLVKVCFWRTSAHIKTVKYDHRFRSSPYCEFSDGEFLFFDFIASRGGRISLREFIEFWNLEGKEAILQLLDRKECTPIPSSATYTEEQDESDTSEPPLTTTGGQIDELGPDLNRSSPADLPDETVTVAPARSRSSPEGREGGHIVLSPRILQSRAAIFVLGKQDSCRLSE